MKSKFGIILMLIGGVCIMVSVFLAGSNMYSDYKGGKSSEEVLEVLKAEIESREPNEFFYTEYSSQAEESVLINDNLYIGIISIPEIGIELPVMSSWDYDRLDISPCLYYEDSSKKIIAAHNYSSHFGGIKNLGIGDEVYFTDVNNNTVSYSVMQTDILDGYDTEKMRSGNDWELTLFTCTLSGTQRVAVRCRKSNDQSVPKSTL